MTDRDPRELLAAAHRALIAGDSALAGEQVERLRERQRDWPPAVHLAGLIARAQGDLSRAEDLMRRSLDLPGVKGRMRAEYANNLGNLLRGAGYPAQAEAAYRHALEADDLPAARTGLARTLLEVDRPDEALTVLRPLRQARVTAIAAGGRRRDTPNAGPDSGIGVTVLLSEALAQVGERQEALAVLAQAGEQDASQGSFWLALGARLGSVGRYAEAESALRALLSGPFADKALTALTDLQVLQQDWRGALTQLRDGVRAFPGDATLQIRLAGLEWMLGDTQHFADALRRSVAERPDDRSLRLALIGVLDNAGLSDEAEREMRTGFDRHAGDYHFAALLATRCAATGRPSEAGTLIAIALARAPELGFVREQAAIVTLVAGLTVDALAHTAWLVDRSPTGQTAWSLRTLALRLAGDPSWRSFAEPSQVCRQATLQPPAGYASLDAYNDVLASRLRTRHTLQAHPLVNSVRGGTQVEIHPGSETDPVLRDFFEMIRAPITEYITSMPEDSVHPLFRRKAGAYRLSGCWTVRLEGGGGQHVGHIHPRGWISSAYYVSVPPEIPEHPQRAGWLAFGKPPYPVPGLSPTGWVQPQAGRLALFPSYQWHDVEPYPGSGERMTIAFDVMPIAMPATR